MILPTWVSLPRLHGSKAVAIPRRRSSWLSAFPLFVSGGSLIERDGALGTSEACCCLPGTTCSPCTQCIRGAWVTIPAFASGDTSSYTCECASVAGTYYIPIGFPGINCTPSEPYNPSCAPISNLATGACLWENRPSVWSCTGCWEVYWEAIPGCDDNSPGDCVVTDGGAQAWKIRAAIGWGISSVKEGGVWRFRSYVSFQDFGFFAFWVRDFTSALTGDTADCSQHNADLSAHCGGDVCTPGSTASLLLDFGPCP